MLSYRCRKTLVYYNAAPKSLCQSGALQTPLKDNYSIQRRAVARQDADSSTDYDAAPKGGTSPTTNASYRIPLSGRYFGRTFTSNSESISSSREMEV
jgi:hypothetical protein